ncbi:MAG: energy transducer TonB [Alphaproteobacteria bacterium]|nr:energy transducer TonB [Alphaproteobacteria bacterium]
MKSRAVVSCICLFLFRAEAPPESEGQSGGTAGQPPAVFTGAKYLIVSARDQCDPAHAVQPGLVVTWTGACKDKLPDGAGTITLADRSNTHRMTMHALFVHGVAEGPQSITFPDGNVFDGVFHQDQPNGHGRMRYADGSVLEGEFRNDLLEGTAHTVDAAGTVTDASYRNGQLDGPWAMLYTGGFRVDGVYRAGKRNGPWTVTFADVSRLTFVYADDTVQTEAAYVTTAGQRVEGAFLPPRPAPGEMHQVHHGRGAHLHDAISAMSVMAAIASDGHVASLALTRSSGIKDLDAEVLADIATWTFLPATVGGQPVPSLQTVRGRVGDAGLVFDEALEK